MELPWNVDIGIPLIYWEYSNTYALSEFGFEKIFSAVIKNLYSKGETKESIINKVNSYPISKTLKLKLYELIRNLK
jgi:hypothetical protein